MLVQEENKNEIIFITSLSQISKEYRYHIHVSNKWKCTIREIKIIVEQKFKLY